MVYLKSINPFHLASPNAAFSVRRGTVVPSTNRAIPTTHSPQVRASKATTTPIGSPLKRCVVAPSSSPQAMSDDIDLMSWIDCTGRLDNPMFNQKHPDTSLSSLYPFNPSSPAPTLSNLTSATPSSSTPNHSRSTSTDKFVLAQTPPHTTPLINSSPITPITAVGDDFDSEVNNVTFGLGLHTGEVTKRRESLRRFFDRSSAVQAPLKSVALGDQWIADPEAFTNSFQSSSTEYLPVVGDVFTANVASPLPPITPPTSISASATIYQTPHKGLALPLSTPASRTSSASSSSTLVNHSKWNMPTARKDQFLESPSPSPLLKFQTRPLALPQLPSMTLKRKRGDGEEKDKADEDFSQAEIEGTRRTKKQRRSPISAPIFNNPISASDSDDIDSDAEAEADLGDDADEDPKPFQCRFPNCGSSFARAHDRQRHLATHTGALPYKCHGGCFTAYARPDKRQRHWDRAVDGGLCERRHYDAWIHLPEEETRVGKPRGADARDKLRAAEKRWEEQTGRVFVKGVLTTVETATASQEAALGVDVFGGVTIPRKSTKRSSKKAKVSSAPSTLVGTSTKVWPARSPAKTKATILPSTTASPTMEFDIESLYPASVSINSPLLHPQLTLSTNYNASMSYRNGPMMVPMPMIEPHAVPSLGYLPIQGPVFTPEALQLYMNAMDTSNPTFFNPSVLNGLPPPGFSLGIEGCTPVTAMQQPQQAIYPWSLNSQTYSFQP
ncbi:hypothetical protein FRB95_009537 [Tulasnella sp. JGI-2019a]|nr:hypothetical protein FRB95_009537 [Tulasnella sp. JGI-2019a]